MIFLIVENSIVRGDFLSISSKIKAICNLTDTSIGELSEVFGVTRQVVSNKLSRNQLTLKDLLSIADYLDVQLCFVLKDGSTIRLTTDDLDKL